MMQLLNRLWQANIFERAWGFASELFPALGPASDTKRMAVVSLLVGYEVCFLS